jgi:deoxyribonuclease V
MAWNALHTWDVDSAEARRLQRSLAKEVVLSGSAADAATVAGLDVSYDPTSDRLAAAVVILDTVTLEPIDQTVVIANATFPYESGLFAFRELPPLLDALASLTNKPDLLLCDGHGYAHPERFGLACHAGLWTGIPSIGCAKTSFIGTPDTELADDRGSTTPLIDRDETIGTVLRTQHTVKPVYVSPGHLIGIDDATAWVLRLVPRYRLPEPIRAADHLGRQALKDD